mmetsp:Transcript_13020/g.27555  ORF Transcript_13020/g.27555 Transcript_13020/m.27555 type:complete len:86 (+) Transcript_13020:272-529(+)
MPETMGVVCLSEGIELSRELQRRAWQPCENKQSRNDATRRDFLSVFLKLLFFDNAVYGNCTSIASRIIWKGCIVKNRLIVMHLFV